MFLIEGEIRKEEYMNKIFTIVKFEADELCKNNIPYMNLFLFCLMHDMLKKVPDKNVFVPDIDLIDLRESKDERKTEMAKELCKHYNILIF